jgi:MoaA/NifB/PqqE/SkfB family radical SAM enzyme
MPNPFVATVEPVSTCPVKCEMCPVSRDDVAQPKAGLMSLAVAGAVASRLRHDFGVQYAAFGNWGEPLLHPQLTSILAIFAQVGISTLYLTSSLSARFDAEALVCSDLDYLDISISGLDAEVYNRGHRHGNWARVEANMAAVAEARRRHPGALQVGLRWHRYKHNEHQLAAAAELAERHHFEFKPYFGHLGGIDAHHDFEHGTLPESKRRFIEESVFLDFVQRSVAEHRGGTHCPQAQNLVIHSDGRLLHCCALMESHQTGVDFLTLPRHFLERFKNGPNRHCGECLAKGWSGFMHAAKVERRSGEELARSVPARAG